MAETGIVITVSGLHGTGKSTIAELLARNLKVRYLSAGDMFRKMAEEKGLSLADLSERAAEKDDLDRLVDRRTQDEAKRGNVVIEGLLAAWEAEKDADLHFYLYADDDTRFSRIARRDKCSLEEARTATLRRESLERVRFKRFYAIDIDDFSIYDLKLNTALLSPHRNAQILECFARLYMEEQEVK